MEPQADSLRRLPFLLNKNASNRNSPAVQRIRIIGGISLSMIALSAALSFLVPFTGPHRWLPNLQALSAFSLGLFISWLFIFVAARLHPDRVFLLPTWLRIASAFGASVFATFAYLLVISFSPSVQGWAQGFASPHTIVQGVPILCGGMLVSFVWSLLLRLFAESSG